MTYYQPLSLTVNFSNFRLLCVSFLLVFVTQGAAAQGIEEVVIAAERAEEALDDLVSVSALDAGKLADAGIENVEDVAAYVPNLVLTQTETGTSIVIRGIGAGANQGFDQSVGLYVDGVPLPRANMARAPFLDLSSVQVLRGPQFVLDGSYSIAGSVHMLTNLSTDEFKAGVDFNYVPSQNAKRMLLTVGGPINEQFAASIALQSSKSDGYVENVTRGEGNEKDDLIARLVLGWQPTDNLSFKLKTEKGTFKTVGRAVEIFLDQPTPDLTGITGPDRFGNVVERKPLGGAVFITTEYLVEADYIHRPLRTQYRSANGFLPGGDYLFSNYSYLERLAAFYTNPYLDITNSDAVVPTAAPIPKGLLDDELNFKRGADLPEFSRNDSLNYTLNTDYWLGDHQLKSTSSYVEYRFTEQIDADFTAAPLLKINQVEDYEQLFQRFDYKSPEGEFIEIQAGASYLHSKLKYGDRTQFILTEKPGHTNNTFTTPSAPSLDFDPNELSRQYFGAVPGLGNAILSLETYGPDRIFEQDTDITAVFFNANFHWSDTVRTKLGLRYTHMEKEATRDLAIVDRDGNIPAESIGLNRTVKGSNLQSMLNLFVTAFGVQIHTSRYGNDPSEIALSSGEKLTTFGVAQRQGSRREEKLLPSFTIEWDISDDFSSFFSVRKAAKFGGFDARSNSTSDVIVGSGAPFGTFEFLDEEAITYELGSKWFLPGGWGEVTAVAFYSDYTNLQISRFDGKSGFSVDNAGAANTKGIEVEGLLQVSDRFSVNYSLAWIDFTFEDFKLGTCHLGRRADTFLVAIPEASTVVFLGSDGTVYKRGDFIPIRYEGFIRPSSGVTSAPWVASDIPRFVNNFDDVQLGSPAFCDFKGNTNQFVAEWQGTFSFNYETEITNIGLLKPTLDVLYNSGYFASASQDPLAAQDEYIQLNGRIAVASFDDAWEVALTGQNLTNRKIISYANETPIGARFQGARGFAGFVRPPRTIGLNVRYKFY